jgi:hypothetical protein
MRWARLCRRRQVTRLRHVRLLILLFCSLSVVSQIVEGGGAFLLLLNFFNCVNLFRDAAM